MDNNVSNNDFSIENAFTRLREINQQLESQNVSLKDSIALYSEGVNLVNTCKNYLTEVEKEIQELSNV
ncbi:MAG: exodeoxyribonuclease VII small subunit [Lachnospiraceae bacterium]|nr:exodeoxyribonuclease VII small subunit [Lachnospiraceae bacterium]